ncbi:MAG: YtxH domain-containing protein [Candidatus Latescibacterota bacterium]|nr:YtxH domain-containing protein [Candidatus Latescibacterota bacterium]
MPYVRGYSREPESQITGFLAGCVAGIVIGTTLGLLMAPHRGVTTRKKITRRAEEAKDQVVEKMEDLMVHRSEEVEDADAEANN